jgi:hypothetical protein
VEILCITEASILLRQASLKHFGAYACKTPSVFKWEFTHSQVVWGFGNIRTGKGSPLSRTPPLSPGLVFQVLALGCAILGMGITSFGSRIPGSGFPVSDSEFRVLIFRYQCSGVRLRASWFQVSGSELRVEDLLFSAQWLDFRASVEGLGVGCWVLGHRLTLGLLGRITEQGLFSGVGFGRKR